MTIKYRGYTIEVDQDFDGADCVYLYPPGADDYGIDPIECETVKRAKEIADDIISEIAEDRAMWGGSSPDGYYREDFHADG